MTDHRLTPDECRIGRAALGWNQEDLARAANVSLAAVQAFETVGGEEAETQIETSFAAAGVTFHLRPDGRAFMKARTLDGIIEAPVALSARAPRGQKPVVKR